MKHATTVDPQQLAQCGGITAIGLLLFSIIGLDQDHFVTAVVVQHVNQPVAEPASIPRYNI